MNHHGIKTRNRYIVIGMMACLLVLSALLGACSTKSGEGTDGNAKTSGNGGEGGMQEIVELKAFFPGDTPGELDKVLAAVNDKMAKDGIGAKLSIQFVPWDDYGNLTTLKTTAGEDFDMFLDAPWLHIMQMIASSAVIPLDDYVNNAPNLKNSIPEQMWNENKFNGKIYGIPLGTTQGPIYGFLVRKDLREKYGLPEIKTLEQFEAYLYEVRKNEKDIVPFGIDGRYGGDIFSWFNPQYFTGGRMYFPLAAGVYADPDGKISESWETPGMADLYRKMNKFYKDGIFEKNILQQQNAVELFNKGKFGATMYSADGVTGMKYLNEPHPDGMELEIVMPFAEGVKPYSEFKQWNFLVVHSKSKHPEVVIKVMDWLSIRENHDLLEYGIEGTHWKALGDDQYESVSGSNYSFPGYVMTWRPALLRTPSSMLPEDKQWFDKARDASSFIRSPSSGFSADLDPIKTEVAKWNTIATQVGLPLTAGVLDTDKGLEDLRKQAKSAGMDKIVEEIQKQYTAFIQSGK